MRSPLRAAKLLAEPAGPASPERKRVLFLVHRAIDGWLSLDLLGETLESLDGSLTGDRGGDFWIRRGGEEFTSLVFSLHAFGGEPAGLGSLRVPCCRRRTRRRQPGAFAFGGDLLALLRRAQDDPSRRLLLFRGITVIGARAESQFRGLLVPATRALVFETPVWRLWRAVHEAACGLARDREMLAAGSPPDSATSEALETHGARAPLAGLRIPERGA